MPRPHPPADVAAANQYLGALGRKRRPAWITASPAACPTPRKKRLVNPAPPPDLPPRTQSPPDSAQQPSSTGTNVLPSPAPSDQASPTAAAIAHDSANKNPPPDDAPRRMESSGPAPHATCSASLAEAVPSTSAALAPPAPDHQARYSRHGSPSSPAPAFAIDASTAQSTPTASHAPGPSPMPAQPAFALHQQPMPPNGALPSALASLVSREQSPQVQAGSLPMPSFERRHSESAHPTSLSIQQNLLTMHQEMKHGLDRARLQLLVEAYKKSDIAFLHIHQAFCAWSLGQLAALTGSYTIRRELADKTFGILEKVLKENRKLCPTSIQSFAYFPGPLVAACTESLAAFLYKMANHWESMVRVAFSRKRPLLVSEMICVLGCQSPTMQKLLFTANRRSLGILDNTLGETMDFIFNQDQQEAMSHPEYRADSTYTWQELEANSQVVVSQYHACFHAAVGTASNEAGPIEGTPWHLAPAVSSPQAPQTPFHPAHQQAQPTTHPGQVYRQSGAAMPRPASGGPSRRLSTMGSVGSTGYATHAQAMPQTTGPGAQRTVPSNGPPLRSSVHTAQQFHGGLALPSQGYHAPALVQASQQSNNRQSYMPPSHVAQSAQPASFRHPHNNQLIADYRRQSLSLVQGRNPTTPVLPSNNGFPAGQQVVYPSEMHSSNIAPHPMVSAGTSIPSNSVDLQARLYHSHQSLQSPAAAVPPEHVPRTYTRPLSLSLFPRPGELIPRTDYAHDQFHESSLNMSYHQVHLRSPVRTSRTIEKRNPQPQERHYQFVSGFAVAPVLVRGDSRCATELTFNVDDETLSRLSKPVTEEDGVPQVPVYEYEDGTLRLRLRCCKIRDPKDLNDMSQSKWVNTESCWPGHIFMMLNGKTALTPRRKTHYGKDLPAELTPHVVGGKNQVKVVVAISGLAPAVENYAVAVETILTKSHSSLWSQIRNNQVMSREKTVEVIRKRIEGDKDDEDDDGIMVVTDELPIDLADPFSAVMFETPVRGSMCTHLECFDLGTWLQTRERKPQSRECVAHRVACDSTCRWRIFEPTMTDKWRCPIKSCNEDARPCNLVVDEFLTGVRQTLKGMGRLDARGIRVKADGTWRPVPERKDDGGGGGNDSDSDCDRKAPPVGRATPRSNSSAYPDVRALHPQLPDIIDLT